MSDSKESINQTIITNEHHSGFNYVYDSVADPTVRISYVKASKLRSKYKEVLKKPNTEELKFIKKIITENSVAENSKNTDRISPTFR